MKLNIYALLFILLALILVSCQGSSTTPLEATNQALQNQVTSLMTQLTQVGVSPVLPTSPPSIVATNENSPLLVPEATSTPPPTQQTGVIAPNLAATFSGTIIPWNNPTLYLPGLYATANVHMICDPNGSADGKLYIDKDNFFVGCDARGEGWALWKPEITAGDHYVYSANAGDKYEFWGMGTTPFTIHNKYSRTDFMFSLPKAGIYTLTANLIKGAFNVNITCEQAQFYNYKITQSTTIPVIVEQPASCLLFIRDVEQAKTSLADIEVSLAFEK